MWPGTRWILEKDALVYDLEAKAYDKLIQRYNGSTTPCILVVLCLPKDHKDWLVLDEEHLLLRRCCYWDYITGPSKQNVSSVRIRISRKQLFTPECVEELVAQILEGDFFK